MRKINGLPIEAIADISETKGGEALKWDNANTQMVWELHSGSSLHKWYGDRGVFAGGVDGGTTYDVIDYIDITSTGNASDFGNLTSQAGQLGA